MPLPWVRLDSNIATNPKILVLLAEREGYRAAFVYVCSLGYCGGHETDGFIAREALGFVHARKRDADLLVKHRFWLERHGGWQIHEWGKYQQLVAETEAIREELSMNGQQANNARWAGHTPMSGAERAQKYRDRKREQS